MCCTGHCNIDSTTLRRIDEWDKLVKIHCFKYLYPQQTLLDLSKGKQLILFPKNSNVTHGKVEDEDLRLLLSKEGKSSSRLALLCS